MRIISSAIVLLAIALCSACGPAKNPAAGTNAAPPVTLAAPVQADITDQIALDGVVAPSASVALVARVAGTLQEAPFHEGDGVRRGQLLFVIEPEPYRQQVKLNQARLDQARADTERQETLLKENATSQASVENSRSQMQQAEANLRLAQINLSYTEVRAPFDGAIGKRVVDVGNYVGAAPGGTVLATLQKLRPAYVVFSIGERDLLALRNKMPDAQNGRKPGVGSLPVRVTLQGESTPSATGVLDFIDNNLNGSSGTIQLRARVDNEDLHLIPGLYARAAIDTGGPRTALMLPSSALLSDQQGSYLYVVDTGNHAHRRNVSVGAQRAALREITAGLKAGERVVVAGVGNIHDAQLVAPHDAAVSVTAQNSAP